MSKIVRIRMHLQCMLVHWHAFSEHTASSEMHTECSTHICNQSMNALVCTYMQQTETMHQNATYVYAAKNRMQVNATACGGMHSVKNAAWKKCSMEECTTLVCNRMHYYVLVYSMSRM